MRARLQRFLPIVLIALAMQVLAPIAACWAAGLAVADPLEATAICHSAGGSGAAGDDQTGAPSAHGGSCSICCLAQAAASFDAPQSASAFLTPSPDAERVVWRALASAIVAFGRGSSAQARAPPHLS